uniref:Uncharacterized protein n=1 Tax=Setaria italica TaxID=4555 RepID=K3XMH1_SETIT
MWETYHKEACPWVGKAFGRATYKAQQQVSLQELLQPLLFPVLLNSTSDVGCLLRCSFWYLLSALIHMPTTATQPMRAQVAIARARGHAPASTRVTRPLRLGRAMIVLKVLVVVVDLPQFSSSGYRFHWCWMSRACPHRRCRPAAFADPGWHHLVTIDKFVRPRDGATDAAPEAWPE